jgi:hypothetical protein
MTDLHPALCAEAVWLTVSIAALGSVFHFILRPTLADGFRQKLFAQRRELFLYAYSFRVPFDHPAYLRLRLTMNALIREAKSISVLQIVLVALVLGKPPVVTFESLLVDLEPHVKAKLSAFNERMCLDFGLFTISKSPLGWVMFVLLVLFASVRSGGESLRRAVKNRLSVDAEQLADTLSAGDDCGMTLAA